MLEWRVMGPDGSNRFRIVTIPSHTVSTPSKCSRLLISLRCLADNVLSERT